VVSEVEVEHRAGVAVLGLNRPVANALAPSLRRALFDEVKAALADADVRAIVLKGMGQEFSSGVDISEYEGPLQEPWVGDLCELIEKASKPIVASLHGAALGAGFELALAAHGRVADRAARIALPEVTLGLIPGAGGTQRLARITGAQAALEFLLSGRATVAGDPKLRRVFDRLLDGDPLEEAVSLASDMASAGTWIRTKDREPGLTDPEAYQRAVQAVAARVGDSESAERDIVKCIEAAQLLPFDQGIQFERTLFEDRLASEAARASRHLFAAERRAGAMPERSKGRAHAVNLVAVLANGPLTVEVAIQCLDAGHVVLLTGGDGQHIDAIKARVSTIYDAAIKRKRLDSKARDERLSRLKSVPFSEVLMRADLVLDDGTQALPEAAEAIKSNAVWTSLQGEMLEADRLRAVGAQGKHVVLKYSRPAHSTSLVELAVPEDTDPDAVASIVQNYVKAGRTVVRSALIPGLLRENLFFSFFGAALALCRAGVAPEEIDEAAHELGFQKGPFAMADAEGLPQVQSRHKSLCEVRSQDVPKALSLLSARIASGAKGRAAGRGIFLYEDGEARPDPELEGWLAEWRREAALELPANTDVKRALHSAFINEAIRLIENKRVLRASDLDVVAVKGMGYDRRRGGPLLQADFAGLLALMQDMKKLSPLDEAIWRPQPRLVEMVKYGVGFFGRAV
jgi:3-hydroxyacyl-CoA dehydrogenase